MAFAAPLSEPILGDKETRPDAPAHPRLLQQLAPEGLRRRLSELDVPAREVPVPRFDIPAEQKVIAQGDQAAG